MRARVLTPHGQACLDGELHEGVTDGGQLADVVVAVQMRGRAAEQALEALELRRDLRRHLGGLRARGRVPRVADEAAGRVDEGAAARQRFAEREVDVEA